MFPSSGEINFRVLDADACFEVIKKRFSSSAISISEFDGLSMSFEHWRFNLRQSNTEPLLRLNIETKANNQLLEQKVKEMQNLLQVESS